MKISNAIEAGSKGRRQIYGAYYNHIGDVCALGAASFGMTGQFADKSLVFHGWILENRQLTERIQNMNDKEKLTFEQIVAKLREEGL